MWHKLINPYSTISKSRQGLIYYGSVVKHCADDYIDAIQAIEKDIDQQHVVDQIEIAYELRDIKDRLEKVREKLKANNVEMHYRRQS